MKGHTLDSLAHEIDSLARMVADGFLSTERSAETLEKSVQRGFERIEQEIRSTNDRIDKIVIPSLDDHATRIKDLELRAQS